MLEEMRDVNTIKTKYINYMKNKKLKASVVDKDEFLLDLCSGKSVLHLGCAGIPYQEYKSAAGMLLHENLYAVTKKIAGVDLSREGIDFLKSKGFENLYWGNVEELDKLGIKGAYDVIVAGELVEHLSNVGKFFEGLSSFMDKDSELVITVPNANSLKSFMRIFAGRELIHPDHAYYFSPATIEQFCERHGFEIAEYFYYLSEPYSLMKKLMFYPVKLLIKYVSPYVSDGIIFLIKKRT